MILPPKPDGSRLTLRPTVQHITIIGANGAGKTMFTNRLISDCEGPTFCISTLRAIYSETSHPTHNTVDRLYDIEKLSPSFFHNDVVSGFDRLISLMLNEEVMKLLEFKVKVFEAKRHPRLPSTKLDKTIEHWQQLFPGSHIMRDGGRLLFSREGTDDTYSQMKLSDGEKAAFYALGATMFAPRGATVFVDSPAMFMHPSIVGRLWDMIEQMRHDCRFVYTTHDLEFVATRAPGNTVWVQGYDPASQTWDYEILPPDSGISDDIYMAIIGTRKPVLFIEGDGLHSIDARLYPLIFPEYTVKSLGSCNKVIEATRTFNDLRDFHHLESFGIVDRDRRDDGEVKYLREKKILVPEVAEIENMLLLEGVVKGVAKACDRDAVSVFGKVKRSVIKQFKGDLKQQALLHTRHRVKRTLEYRIDGRFADINSLEEHIFNLLNEIDPRGLYERFCREFRNYIAEEDYEAILRVYNCKSMLPSSNVASLCGMHNKEEYIAKILAVLRGPTTPASQLISEAIRTTLHYSTGN